MQGAVKWCNICNARPAQGSVAMLEKATNEIMSYDCCAWCIVDIMNDKVDWIENGLES